MAISRPDLERIIASAPKRYKVYDIPKRSGGFRTIAQPSYELKVIQRYLVDKKLSRFRVHRSATAYRKKGGIAKNARVHSKNDVLLKLDFVGFFPSLSVNDFRRFVKRSDGSIIEYSDINSYAKVLFWGMGTRRPICLSIGAPSSPVLSNILMFDIDEAVHSVARELGVKYTRYADDIALSSDTVEKVLAAERRLISIVEKSVSPKLVFNDKKRGLYLRGQRRTVTGLVITPERNVSLGRDRKRLISSMMHRAALGQLSSKSLHVLRGYLAFALDVEGGFVDRLKSKYGTDQVNAVLRMGFASRDEWDED